MTLLASLAALCLTAGAILHSYAYMYRKMPDNPQIRYPQNRLLQILIDLLWITLAAGGFLCAWLMQGYFLSFALVLFFIVLPFAIQPSLAKLFGFHTLRAFLEAVDAREKDAEN